MKTLFTSEWGDMKEDPARRLCVFERSNKPMKAPEQLPTILSEMATVIGPQHRDYGLVIDLRKVPGNNDARLEQATQDNLGRVLQAFSRTVMLVASAAGMLQIKRLSRGDGLVRFVTNDEAKALAFAAGEISSLD